MELETARRLSELLLMQVHQLDDELASIQSACTQNDFELARQMIGKIMGVIYLDALYPVFLLHPSLRPEGIDP